MILSNKDLNDKRQWESAGFKLPRFDREAVRSRTMESPIWLHLGAGNIFRAYPAVAAQSLLDDGLIDRGIIVAEGYDLEIIDAVYTAYDDLSVAVTLKSDGGIVKTVVASVVESIKMDSDGLARLREIFSSASLQLVSLTITEKGYSLTRRDGSFLPDVEADFVSGPGSPSSYMGKLASLCYHRYLRGGKPLSLASMDNCSRNGELLHAAIRGFAAKWAASGLAEAGFVDYVDDPACLGFPWSMIDKITPRPDAGVAGALLESGLESVAGVVTAKDTYVAPFVNAEECQYLVIEDAFPNGRPPLQKAGIIVTDRETVEKTEKMKVCTCLNPLHTGLSVFGCLLSFTRVSEMMKDRALRALARRIADEGLPVVVDPGIISPAEFVDTVINVRLPNPFMPDSPQRIATDTSKKIAVRFGATLKSYMRRNDLDAGSLRAIPLSLAGWCRYLLGVGDDGEAFEIDPDPMLDILLPVFSGVELGKKADHAVALRPLLSDASVFGVDLYEAGVGHLVEEYFSMMTAGPGAVRKTLESVLL